jgi:hypothetical protein
MTSDGDDLSLSRLELVVLARTSTKKAPSEREVAEAVLELALPSESLARAKEVALATLAGLRERGLVSEQGRSITEDGRRALRTALDLVRAPTWKDVRDLHLPALALGIKPSSELVTRTLRSSSTIAAAAPSTAQVGHSGARTRLVQRASAAGLDESGVTGSVTAMKPRGFRLSTFAFDPGFARCP